MRKPALTIFQALCAFSALAMPAASADWPMFRGNVARTGYTAEQAAPPLLSSWTFQAAGGIFSSPAAYDGAVYFGARDGYVYSLDARTGTQLWRFRTGNWVDSSPCVSTGIVYASSMDGYMYAIGRDTGEHVWRASLGGPSVSSPLLYGNRVYVGAGLPANRLFAFDAVTGDLLGSFAVPQPPDSAPAQHGQNIYFAANDGGIYSLDSASLLAPAGWTPYPSGGSFRMNALALSEGVIFALPGHDDKRIYRIDSSDGNELSRSEPVESKGSWQTFSSPAVGRGRIYFAGSIGETASEAAGDEYLSAVDSATLSSVWSSSPSLGPVSNMGALSSPALANDFVLIGTVDGRLVSISSDGTVAASLDLSSSVYSSPAVANGMIYVGSMDGRMYAFRSGRSAALSYPSPGTVVSGTVPVRGYFSNPDLAGYKLEYAASGGVWHTLVSSAVQTPAEGAVLAEWDTSALPNGDYRLRLTINENGLPALDNTAVLQVRVNASPYAPSGLTAYDVPGDSGNRIRLEWTASPSPGLTAYRVYRDGGRGLEPLSETGPGSLVYTDTAAPSGLVFTYAVRAYDGWVESENSNMVSASAVNNTGDVSAPAAAADLSAVSVSPGSALLSWTASGNDGDIGTPSHYTIKYTTSAGYDWAGFDSDPALGAMTHAAEGPAGSREAEEVRWLLGSTSYYFALKAADYVPNLSPLSNVTTVYIRQDPSPPSPPSGLNVADVPGDEGNNLEITWTLSPDDGAGAGDVYGYRLYRRSQGAPYDLAVPLAEIERGVGSYVDTSATTNVRFYYALSAYDSSNDSSLSAEASGMSADNWRFFDMSQGASIRLLDGARVDIAPDSATQNDNIMMIKVSPDTFQPLSRVRANTGARPTGAVYEIKFKNSATKLLKPALITLPYTEAETAGMNQENLRIYMLSGGTWLLVDTSRPDVQTRKVTAEVEHFSVYSIMEYLPSGEFLEKDEVYTYPNPAKGDSLTFKFRTAYRSDVKIDVYNIAGEKVAAFEKADCPAGLTSEIVWNIRGIASGVYQYRVEAGNASGSKSLIKRLAIIH